MKKVIWFILAAVCLCACSESMEEKANKLIKKELNKVIVNIDTYEPIETQIDSAFAPLMTAEYFDILKAMPAQIRRLSGIMNEIDTAKRGMSLTQNGYYSFEREKYKEFKEQYESANNRLHELETKMEAVNERVNQMKEAEPVFNGYRVIHQYRYTKEDGTKTIGKHFFLMNKDFSAVETMLDMEDQDIKDILEMAEINSFGE